MADDKWRWSFAIPITVRFSFAWLFFTFVIGLAVVFWYNYSNDELRRTIIFGTSIIGGVLVIWGILQAGENIRRSNHEKKVSAAFRFMERWNDPAFVEMKKGWRKMNENVDSLGESKAADALEEDLETRMIVATVLNFFEEMAIAIRTASADEEMLKRYFRTIVVKTERRYGFWMRTHRERRKAPRYWIEIEEVMKNWKRD